MGIDWVSTMGTITAYGQAYITQMQVDEKLVTN